MVTSLPIEKNSSTLSLVVVIGESTIVQWKEQSEAPSALKVLKTSDRTMVTRMVVHHDIGCKVTVVVLLSKSSISQCEVLNVL
jgi:hypothetical protein